MSSKTTVAKYVNPKVIHGKDYETVDVIYDIIDQTEEKIEETMTPKQKKRCNVIFTIIRLIVRLMRWAIIGMFSSCIENLFVRFFIHAFTFMLLIFGGYISIKFLAYDVPTTASTLINGTSEVVTEKIDTFLQLFASCYDPSGKPVKC